MPYRKRSYTPRRKFTLKRKYPYRRPVKRSSFAKRVKRVIMKNAEPKKVSYNHNKTELYHNVPVLVAGLNSSVTMPSQGVGDNQRVGDQINASGYMVKMLFGQKSDRENVTFKLWVFQVPKGSTYNYSQWFDNVTGNCLLDDVNEDFVKVLAKRTFKYEGVPNDNAHEFTFAKKLWIPYRKIIKFGPANAAVTFNDPVDVVMYIAAYDAYGTLATDNIGYIATCTALHFRDP